jgi:Holliday junction resolvasome RuvABC endonuclease subunit
MTKKPTLAQTVQPIPQPATPLMGQLASLAEYVGMPLKALTLGAVNWAQTTLFSLGEVLDHIHYARRQEVQVAFPWNGVSFLLAVDPGSVCMGWAVIRLPDFVTPSRNTVLGSLLSIPLPGEVVDAGIWRLSGSKGANDIYTRLARLVDFTQRFPYSRGIRALALEDQFIGNNARTALIIGRSRGWVEFWAAQDLDIIDFFHLDNREVKMKFSGKGNASKEVMTAKAEQLFPLSHIPRSFRDNAGDAIALGTVAYKAYLDQYHDSIALQS